MSIIDMIMGVITAPYKTLGSIVRNKPIYWAIIINIFLIPLYNITLTAVEPDFYLNGKMLFLNTVVSVISGIGFLLFVTLIFTIVGRIFGGQWDYWGLFSALSFSNVIYVFTPFVALISVLVDNLTLIYLFSFIIFIWMTVLYIYSFKNSLKLSTGKAVATYLLSCVAAVVTIFLVVLIPVLILLLMGVTLI